LITKSDAFGSSLRRATKWQRIGNQIDAAFIFARPDFVNVHGMRGAGGLLMFSYE
jgi:hypothetical protein